MNDIDVSYRLKGLFCSQCGEQLWNINKGDYSLVYCDNMNCGYKHKNKHLW